MALRVRNRVEKSLDRRDPKAIQCLLVHELLVEDPDPACLCTLKSALCRVRSDLIAALLRQVMQRIERAVRCPVRRNLVLTQPGSVDVAVEVILGTDSGVHQCGFEDVGA